MNEILVERDGPIALVTLNRPEKRNALSIQMRFATADLLEGLAADQGVSVVVLTGSPPAFCSGMDHTQFGGDEANRRALVESTERFFGVVSRFTLPLVAAVNGPAIGGGCALAGLCDIRLASPDARFGHPEVDRGVPAPYGALIAMMPEQIAREVAFTGRILDADEALVFGIVREVALDVVGRARELAARMAALPRLSLERSKALVLAAAAGGPAARAGEAELAMFRDAVLPPR